MARELQWTAGIDSADIAVAVSDSVVTLSGTVGTYPERLLAESAASDVRGVTVTTEAGGLVTLDGVLDSSAEVARAESITWSALGVTAIANYISVSVGA